MNQKYQGSTNWSQFSIIILVFFFLGFFTASNTILTPFLEKLFNLSKSQSQLVQVSFYVAYTVGAILYLTISKIIGRDLLNRIGYKNGIVVGLFISGVGTFLFYFAPSLNSFPFMLFALLIVGLGFSLLQTTANPLAIIMGDPKNGSQRLTLGGAANNLGTTVGPVIVSLAIFGSVVDKKELSLESIKMPYLILSIGFIIFALISWFSSIPNKIANVDEEKKDDQNHSFAYKKTSAFQFPQLILGMIGIFIYVGLEVTTQANLPAYMEQVLDISKEFHSPYISLYWASLMIGRWGGSVEAFDIRRSSVKSTLKFLLPYVAFGVFLIVIAIANNDVSMFYIYVFMILVLIVIDMLSKGNPSRMLMYFGTGALVCLLIGIFGTGKVSLFAFVSVGLFCSTMWPCVFSLAINGLGKFTNQGSNFLIMMIMGGGIISWLQASIAESGIGIQYSYFVGVICCLYLIFYAVKVSSILKSQGIDLDKK